MSHARELCYERRDVFYRCAQVASPALAAAGAASTPAAAPASPAVCAAERAAFEEACPRAWVKYWDERVKRGQPLKTPGA